MTDRLPPLRPGEGIRVLKRAGFVVRRASGSHCCLVHNSDPTRKVTVPVHNRELKRGTLRAMIAQAGLTIEEFQNLL